MSGRFEYEYHSGPIRQPLARALSTRVLVILSGWCAKDCILLDSRDVHTVEELDSNLPCIGDGPSSYLCCMLHVNLVVGGHLIDHKKPFRNLRSIRLILLGCLSLHDV